MALSYYYLQKYLYVQLDPAKVRQNILYGCKNIKLSAKVIIFMMSSGFLTRIFMRHECILI